MVDGIRPRRGRPPAADIDLRVTNAATVLYGEMGWSGFSIEAVARRARVGKTSIYQRWNCREDLLVAALWKRVGNITEVDTGALRTDLVALAEQFLELYLGEAGPAVMRLAVEADHVTALDERRETLSGSQGRAALTIVQRAVDRGELPTDASAQLILDALCGAVVFRVMTTAPTERVHLRSHLSAFAEQIAELVLNGAMRSSRSVGSSANESAQ